MSDSHFERFVRFDEDDRAMVEASLASEDARMWKNLARDGSISRKTANDFMPPEFRLDEQNELVGDDSSTEVKPLNSIRRHRTERSAWTCASALPTDPSNPLTQAMCESLNKLTMEDSKER